MPLLTAGVVEGTGHRTDPGPGPGEPAVGGPGITEWGLLGTKLLYERVCLSVTNSLTH